MVERTEILAKGRSLLDATFEPWELDGGSKRDCTSHRADMLKRMAAFSTIAGYLSLFLFPLLVPSLTAMLLGLLTRAMAGRDLNRMQAGAMDNRGYRETEKAWFDSRAAVIVSVLGLLAWFVPIILFFYLFRGFSFAGP